MMPLPARSLSVAVAAALLALASTAHAVDESNLPETLRSGYVGPIVGPADDEAYSRGKLGIVRPGYGRASLYVAWRLMQLPPGTVASESHRRLGDAFLQTRDKPWKSGANEIDDWLQARGALVSTPVPRPDFFRTGHAKISGGKGRPDFDITTTEGNCGADAFVLATRLLHDLAADPALSDADRRTWIAGQDAVFARCSWQPGTMPAPASLDDLPADAPARLKALRAYQHASASFYAGDFDQARREFDAIAATPGHPMRTWAALGAVRAVVRPATLDKTWQAAFDDAYRRQGLRDAALGAALTPARAQHRALQEGAMTDVTNRVKTINADPAFAEVKAQGQYTARRAATQLVPAIVVGWTMDALDRPDQNPYTGNLLSTWAQYYPRTLPDRPDPQTMAFLRGKHAFYDWILSVQACGDAVRAPDETLCRGEHAHALARWQDTKRNDWLLAALMTARQPTADDLPAAVAAQAVPRDRSEWASLQLYAARVLRSQGRADDATRLLDRVAGAPELEARDNKLVATERLAIAR